MGFEFNRVGQRNTKVHVQSHEVPELNQTYCPTCGAGPMDGVTGAHIEEQPSSHLDAPIKHVGFKKKRVYPDDGSPTICAYCGELLVYRKVSEALTLSFPTESEISTFKSNSQFWTLLSNMQNRIRREKRNAKPKRF